MGYRRYRRYSYEPGPFGEGFDNAAIVCGLFLAGFFTFGVAWLGLILLLISEVVEEKKRSAKSRKPISKTRPR